MLNEKWNVHELQSFNLTTTTPHKYSSTTEDRAIGRLRA